MWWLLRSSTEICGRKQWEINIQIEVELQKKYENRLSPTLGGGQSPFLSYKYHTDPIQCFREMNRPLPSSVIKSHRSCQSSLIESWHPIGISTIKPLLAARPLNTFCCAALIVHLLYVLLQNLLCCYQTVMTRTLCVYYRHPCVATEPTMFNFCLFFYSPFVLRNYPTDSHQIFRNCVLSSILLNITNVLLLIYSFRVIVFWCSLNNPVFLKFFWRHLAEKNVKNSEYLVKLLRVDSDFLQ